MYINYIYAFYDAILSCSSEICDFGEIKKEKGLHFVKVPFVINVELFSDRFDVLDSAVFLTSTFD